MRCVPGDPADLMRCVRCLVQRITHPLVSNRHRMRKLNSCSPMLSFSPPLSSPIGGSRGCAACHAHVQARRRGVEAVHLLQPGQVCAHEFVFDTAVLCHVYESFAPTKGYSLCVLSLCLYFVCCSRSDTSLESAKYLLPRASQSCSMARCPTMQHFRTTDPPHYPYPFFCHGLRPTSGTRATSWGATTYST